ncbi:MAG: alpha-2-macroglobulin domain protein [Myxococcales bacterium]|nr:alpha-2-macroglobulin domain protein [Myxococcales bacterium]
MRHVGLVHVGLWALIAGCGGGGSKTNSDLSVTGTPSGEVSQVRVVLAFSRPMVTRDQVQRPGATAPLTLHPPIAGAATWIDDQTLAFVPTQSLPVSTRFVATVPAGIKARDGSALGDAHTFEFFTERLAGTAEVIGSKERASRTQGVRLTFTQEVPFDQVARHCSFVAGSQQRGVKLAPDSNAGPGKDYTIVPDAELAIDTDWKVLCRDGLRGTVGNLGLAKPVEEAFRTFGPLRFVGLTPNANDIVPDEGLRLSIAFTNPLAEPYTMTLTPNVPGFPQRCFGLGDAPAGLSCAVQLEPRTSYTLTIDSAQKDVFGQTLDKPQTLAFRTADALPTISMESGYFVAELKRPVIPVWTRNVSELQVTAVELTPASFHLLTPHLDWWESKPADLSKTKLVSRAKKIAVTGAKNKWGQHSISATVLFGGTAGPGMFYVELGSTEVGSAPYTDGGRQKVLVNFTDIGVVSKLSASRGLVWATQLSTGKPLPGATVTVRDATGKLTWSGITDADGVALLPGTAKLAPKRAAEPAPSSDEEGEGEFDDGNEDRGGDLRIFVHHQADWTMVNPTRSGGLAPWNFNVSVDRDPAPAKLRGFMHTDRGLYRPGDKVHVKGLARVSMLGAPLSVPTDGTKVKVEVEGPQGKTFTEAQARLSAFGGFWFDFDLPADARLGDYVIRATLPHGTFTREFSVEEYRPATFEVSGKVTEAQVVRKGVMHATIAATYLYGAPLRAGNVDVTVHSRSRRVEFPQHQDYRFLDERKYETYYYAESEDSQTLVTEDTVAIDAKGSASLAVSVSPDDIQSDADLLVRATVTAPSNEAISKSFTVPYFRSRTYFGIKAPGYFLDVKKPQKFQVIAVAPDGKVVDGPAKVTVTRRDWNCVWEDWGYRGSYQCKDKTETILSKTLQVVAGKPAEIEFTPTSGGDYWIVVEGDTEKAEASAAAMQVYAWGDGGGSWQSSDTLSFDLVADKKEYKAGDTATLILKTDLAEATGLVTIERDGVIEKRLIQVTPTAKHLSVPITSAHAPNVYVSVALVQGRMGDGPRGKPRMRMGLINLPVRPEDNTLTVAIETDLQDYRPGATVTATVKVTDASGKPASAEVSITAADEGVLSLIGYETPNPVPTFYAPWGIGVTTATQLEFIRDIPGPNLERPATGGDAPGSLRSRFAATAVWKPAAITNAAGIATIQFVAPDNLTAFRIMAVAADKGTRFGSADRRFTVSKPLQLHASLPRFLNLGDQLLGGVVVHNETAAAGTATVKLMGDGHVTTKGGTERTVQLAKGARLPVLFELTAAELGTAVLRFSVTMNGESDAVELKLPVQHPSPVRTKNLAHGATKDALKVPLTLPAHAIGSTAEVVISLDPDGLAGIEDGLRDLIGYPYGCLEQTTSKVIPMLAVRDLAETLAIDGLTGAKLEGFVTAGLAKIGRHQTAYGGFSLWPGGEPEAYYTAYALWGMHLARQAGYKVDQARIDEGLEYLKNDGKSPDPSRPYYNEAGNLGSQAFALYVRAVLGDKDTQAATLLAVHPKLPIYGKAFVARALAAGIGAKDPAVAKLVAELTTLATAAAKGDALIIEPDDRYIHGYMSSSLRTTAIVLGTLVDLDPKSTALEPLVRAVMKARRATEYLDTQQNIYSLLALTSYARTMSGQAPSVTVQLGETTLVSGALSGKQRMRVVSVPVGAATEIEIRPKGQVHYNVEVRYRQTPASLVAESNGVTLTHEYLDEAGKPKATFKVGDIVLVRLSVDLKEDANHLISSDSLPAGFEALNTRLATVGTSGIKQTTEWGTYREMHDDRVDFASEYSSRGVYTHEFMIRAIAVGTFARPPTIAELMYDPAIHARTALDTIEIKGK